METKITRASNGRGIAAQSTVEIIRAPGNMILDVTSTQNFPGVNEDNTVSGEIFHFGCWSADGGGVLVPGTLVEGKAHVSNIGEVTIDSLDPGFTDKGNNIGDIFMVKPTTGWANDMVEALQATLNPDGTLKDNSVTTAAVADNAITGAKIAPNTITADKVDYTTYSPISGSIDGLGTQSVSIPDGVSGTLLVYVYARMTATSGDNIVVLNVSGTGVSTVLQARMVLTGQYQSASAIGIHTISSTHATSINIYPSQNTTSDQQRQAYLFIPDNIRLNP